VAAVATGVGLPRVSPTAVSPARTCPPCPQSSPASAHLYAPSAHPPGLASDHQLSAAMTPDVPVLRSAVLTPVCSTTPANCQSHTIDNLAHLSATPHLQTVNLILWIIQHTCLQHHTCKLPTSYYGYSSTPVCSTRYSNCQPHKMDNPAHLSAAPHLQTEVTDCIAAHLSASTRLKAAHLILWVI